MTVHIFFVSRQTHFRGGMQAFYACPDF